VRRVLLSEAFESKLEQAQLGLRLHTSCCAVRPTPYRTSLTRSSGLEQVAIAREHVDRLVRLGIAVVQFPDARNDRQRGNLDFLSRSLSLACGTATRRSRLPRYGKSCTTATPTFAVGCVPRPAPGSGLPLLL